MINVVGRFYNWNVQSTYSTFYIIIFLPYFLHILLSTMSHYRKSREIRVFLLSVCAFQFEEWKGETYQIFWSYLVLPSFQYRVFTNHSSPHICMKIIKKELLLHGAALAPNVRIEKSLLLCLSIGTAMLLFFHSHFFSLGFIFFPILFFYLIFQAWWGNIVMICNQITRICNSIQFRFRMKMQWDHC